MGFRGRTPGTSSRRKAERKHSKMAKKLTRKKGKVSKMNSRKRRKR